MKDQLLKASLFAAACFAASSAQALVVTESNSGIQLAQTIVGSGITISNIQLKSARGASGFFTGGKQAGLEIEQGVVLSSGSAKGIVGPNNNDAFSKVNNFAGDNDLNTLVAPSQTSDATVLEFDFEFKPSASKNLFFTFQFGSDEYNEYVNSSFNDVFAFSLDGVNIAKLPDNTPISINNINNGKNQALYIDNTQGQHNTQMDGFTKSIKISAKGLSSGKHHMKFAIADTSDSTLDSWILIGAKSFSSVPTQVSEPSSIVLLTLGTLGLALRRRKAKA